MGREQDRRAAIAQAQIELNKKPIYLDTETTGLKENDQIVEIGLLEHDGSLAFQSLVKPTVKIPPDAARVHHHRCAGGRRAGVAGNLVASGNAVDHAPRRHLQRRIRSALVAAIAHGARPDVGHAGQRFLPHEVVRPISWRFEFADTQLSLAQPGRCARAVRSGPA